MIAVGNLRLVKLIQFHRLLQAEEMPGLVVPFQRTGDRRLAVLAARIALSGQDCLDDPHSRHTGDVAHHVVQQQVHLTQRFLHVLDVG